jgi:hypothetical protein
MKWPFSLFNSITMTPGSMLRACSISSPKVQILSTKMEGVTDIFYLDSADGSLTMVCVIFTHSGMG